MPLPAINTFTSNIGGIITGGGTLATADNGVPITGIAWAAGTYTFWIPAPGLGAMDVNIRASAKTGAGAETARIYKVLQDGVTQQVAGAPTVNLAPALAAATVSGARMTDLGGDRYVCFELVVAGGDTMTLNMAEWKGR